MYNAEKEGDPEMTLNEKVCVQTLNVRYTHWLVLVVFWCWRPSEDYACSDPVPGKPQASPPPVSPDTRPVQEAAWLNPQHTHELKRKRFIILFINLV